MAGRASRVGNRTPSAQGASHLVRTPAFAPSPLSQAIRLVLCSCAVTAVAAGELDFAERDVSESLNVPSVSLAVDLDGDGDPDIVAASQQQMLAWFENNGASDPGFSFRTISTAISGINALVAADLDGDGALDLLASSETANRIVWFQNNGPDGFDLTTVAAEGNPTSVFAADLDGDGDSDIIAGTPAAGLRWYENDVADALGFSLRTVNESAEASEVFGADMDSDGDVDVVTIASGDTSIRWFRNNGLPEPGFTAGTIAADANLPSAIYAADLDGDGDTDLLSAGEQNGWLGWHENLGQSFSPRTLDANASVTALRAYDLDADGDADVLTAGAAGTAWYENADGSAQAFTRREITSGSQLDHVQAADLDTDGDLDLITLATAADTVSWHENAQRRRFATYDAATAIAAENQVSAMAVFDVDGDGDLDAASASGTNSIVWYENIGPIPFSARTVASNAPGPSSLTYADLNRDGHVDLIVALEGSGQIVWYENSGTAPALFAERQVEPNAPGATEVVVADLNADGFADVISASESGNTLAWHVNDGGTTPAFSTQTLASTAFAVHQVFNADLDGDGDVDIGAVTDSGETLVWYENDGQPDPAFVLRTITFAAGGISSTSPADLDADGDVDIAVGSQPAGTVGWYENNGETDPAFTFRTLVTGGPGITAISTADAESDGDIDVLIGLGSEGARWIQNHGQGRFSVRDNLADKQVNLTGVADLDGDGDLDVLTADATEIAWHRNASVHKQAAFGAKKVVSDAARSAFAVFAVDLDQDGDTDILSASFQDDKVAWYENDGGQKFTIRTITLQANSTRSVFALDVDRDGDVDVLAASRDDNKVSWYENDGSQNFTEHTITESALEAVFTRAADVDGDGDIDVLSASRQDNKIAWYENDGNEQFSLRTITTDMFYATAVYPVDVNSDGETDVLAASFGDNKVLWFENDGSENFTARTVSEAFDGPRAIHYGDVDADGDVDVVTASVLDNTIAWHEYDGNAAFSPHTISTNALAAAAVLAADLDSDGDLDILSGSIDDDKIAWYENDGAQSFTVHTIDTNSDSPRFVMAADVDGDGDQDALAASRFDNTVAWYENCGGQFETFPQNRAPALATEGERVQLLSVSWIYQGRAGDNPASPDGAAVRWTDAQGAALTAAAAGRLIKRVLLHHDLTGNGLSDDDELLATTTQFATTPVALTGAAQQYFFDGPALDFQTPLVTVLVSADIADFAAAQGDSFQATWATFPSGAQASIPGSNATLVQGCRSEFTSGTVSPQAASDRLFLSKFE